MSFEKLLTKGFEEETNSLKKGIYQTVDAIVATRDYATIILYEKAQTELNTEIIRLSQEGKIEKANELLKKLKHTIEDFLKEEKPEIARENVIIEATYTLLQNNDSITANKIANYIKKEHGIEYDSRGVAQTLKKHIKSDEGLIEFNKDKGVYTVLKKRPRTDLILDGTGVVHADINEAVEAKEGYK